MANLVCDICGGKLTIGAGGIATCSQCGMEYTKERIREKLAEGGVATNNTQAQEAKVDNSKTIKDYFELANTSFNNNGFDEVIKYTDKIIDLDLKNSDAWFLKGKALVLSSSRNNGRHPIGVTALVNSVKYAAEDKREELSKSAWDFLIGILKSSVAFAANSFGELPAAATRDEAYLTINECVKSLDSFAQECGTNYSRDDFYSSMLFFFNKEIKNTYENYIYYNYWDTYEAHDIRPDHAAWNKYLDRVDMCTDLIEKLISITPDKTMLIDITKTMNYLLSKKRDTCSYEPQVSQWDYSTKWVVDYTLTDSAKRSIDDRIRRNNENINKYENEKLDREAKALQHDRELVEAYWKENPEEKKALEGHIAKLNEKLDKVNEELKREKDKINKAIVAKNAEIHEIYKKIGALGLFKIKEKNALKAEVGRINREISGLKEDITKKEKEYEPKITEIEDEIDDIQSDIEWPDIDYGK